jgi:NAD(P)-dependent dehydrogenase (short-subunit alcohol dehydrogenase family)
MVDTTTKNEKKIALVTGANKGIGEAIVKGLAQEGFAVLLGARHAGRGAAAATELQAEGMIQFLQLDVTQDASLRDAVKRVETEFGWLDVLVNNAGVHSGGMPRPPV